MAQRIEYIDLAKGLCISLVVLFHIGQQIDSAQTVSHTGEVFQYFRMPLYYFLSGMFFKGYSGFVDFSTRKINKLLIPYVFFFLASYLVGMMCGFLGFYEKGIILEPFRWDIIFELFTGAEISYNAPIWFLLSLFEVNVMFYVLHNFIKDGRQLLLISLALGMTMSYIIVPGSLPYYLDRTLKFFPFFAMGFYAKGLVINHDRRLAKTYALVALCCFGLIYGVTYLDEAIKGSPWVGYLAGAIGVAMIMIVSNIVGKLPIFSYIGRYSIVVLGFHTFLIRPLKFVFSFFPMPLPCLYVAIFVCVVLLMRFLVIPLSLRLFPCLVAQRDLIRYKQR